MMLKFVGDKKSIEARSDDGGRRWDIKLFDAGHLTTIDDANRAQLDKLVADKRLKSAPVTRT
jgi:hypothetical protein